MFINTEDDLEPLIKISLIHYQFETIHPFLDGNGRIGRLLITLFLIEQRLLNHQTLYISYFLKRNRIEYYDRMMEVRLKGNFEQWIKFFLLAIYESAEDAIATIDLLVELHKRNYATLIKMEKSIKTTMRIFDYIERNPIIDIKKTSAELKLSFNAVSNAINNLVEYGVLRQTENVRRSRCFAYEEYLTILRKDT